MNKLMSLSMIAALVFVFAFAAVAQERGNAPAKLFNSLQPAGTKATCAVSNQEITVSKNTPHSVYHGKVAYFAGPKGKVMFEQNPEKYVAPILFESKASNGTKATCAVSGRQITVSNNTPHSQWNENYVYFAGPMGKTMFDAQPGKYIQHK